MYGPVIEGERVRLVPHTPEMAEVFVRWFADREVTRWMGRICPPSLAEEQEWLAGQGKRENDIVWTIQVEEQPIGAVGIHAINWQHRRAATGTMIGEKSQWGKGYGSEAVRLRTQFAFEQLGLEKLMTEVFAENAASRRALEKAGYRQYGIARRHYFRHGRWQDMWLAEVLHDEWQAMQEARGTTAGAS